MREGWRKVLYQGLLTRHSIFFSLGQHLEEDFNFDWPTFVAQTFLIKGRKCSLQLSKSNPLEYLIDPNEILVLLSTPDQSSTFLKILITWGVTLGYFWLYAQRSLLGVIKVSYAELGLNRDWTHKRKVLDSYAIYLTLSTTFSHKNHFKILYWMC